MFIVIGEYQESSKRGERKIVLEKIGYGYMTLCVIAFLMYGGLTVYEKLVTVFESQAVNTLNTDSVKIVDNDEFSLTSQAKQEYINSYIKQVKSSGLDQVFGSLINYLSLNINLSKLTIEMRYHADEPLDEEEKEQIKKFVTDYKRMMRYIYNNPEVENEILKTDDFNIIKTVLKMIDEPMDNLYKGLNNNDLKGMYNAILDIEKNLRVAGISV